MNIQTFITRLLSRTCCECKEVQVVLPAIRCSFCDAGEGEVKV